MPIGLGMASSHAPAINSQVEADWESFYRRLIRDVPQPPEAAQETPAVLRDYITRVQHAFGTLRRQLADYRPDLLIMIGGDQSETFDSSNVPNLMIYLGEEARGYNTPMPMGSPHREEDLVRLKIDVPTSKWLLQKLVTEEDFDVAFSTEQKPLGTRVGGLFPHAFVIPAPFLFPELDIPVVAIYENTYDPPSLTARRCYDLGRTLARLLRNDPRRIAIYGSGGLSHDPGGPRSGWVDEPLDRWFLDQIASGNGQATTALFKFDSATMRGGTGEIRAWITVAGAMEEMGGRATVVDYIPAHHAVTGLGWASWPAVPVAVGAAP